MIKLKISVTKKILFKARNCGSGNTTGCAIALAVKDIFPLASVTGPYMRYHWQKGEEIKLPKKASKFVYQFDNASPSERIKMNPISFEIEVPDNVIEQINIEEVRPLLQNHPTLELIEP